MTSKRRAIVDQRGNNCNCLHLKCCCDGDGWKRQKCIPSDGLMQGLDSSRYGSVTEDIESLIALRKSYMTFDHENISKSVDKTMNAAENQSQDLKTEHAASPEIIILDDDVQTEKFNLYPVTIDLESENSSSHKISSPLSDIDAKKNVNQISTKHVVSYVLIFILWTSHRECIYQKLDLYVLFPHPFPDVISLVYSQG